MSRGAPAAGRMAFTVMRYGLAVLCVAAALIVTEPLQYFVKGAPWFVFLAAVMISSWVAGLGPGLLAVLLSTVGIDYFFVPPLYVLSLKIEYLPRLVLFGLSAVLVGWLSDRRKRAEGALRQARDELEAKVQERTAELSRTNEDLQAEIAERQRAEEERGQLLAREQAAHAEAVAAQHRFRDLVNSIEGIVWEANAQTFHCLFVSQQAQRVLGYPVERWLSEPTFWKDHIHPDDRERVVEFCLAATAEKRRHEFEYRMLAADGRSVWLRGLVTVVVEQDRATRLRGVMVDITELKRAEAALRESERRYRNIFETAGVSIWEEDFSEVNAAIDALKAGGVRDFRRYLAAHSDFVRQAISAVKIIDVNDATVRLFGAGSKDELLVSLHAVFTPETQSVFAGELVAIAEGRTSFASETVLKTLQGDQRAVLFTMTTPPQPAALDRVLVSIMDITERKQAEDTLRKTQAELAHVTRVLTLGELAASLAHEVNQPLTAVITNGNACLRWLSRDPPDLDEAREAIRRMIRDGKRASEVIARMRAPLRRAEPQKAQLAINDVIGEVIALSQGELRRNGVALHTDLAADLPPVLADRIQLQQVLLNLLLNGMEAMRGVTDRRRELIVRSQKEAADAIRVAVQDAGTGIEPQNLERIFTPFFTTKPAGLGMGLPISRSIIEAHGGRLWATPNVGPGVTVQFTLPTSDVGGDRAPVVADVGRFTPISTPCCST